MRQPTETPTTEGHTCCAGVYPDEGMPRRCGAPATSARWHRGQTAGRISKGFAGFWEFFCDEHKEA